MIAITARSAKHVGGLRQANVGAAVIVARNAVRSIRAVRERPESAKRFSDKTHDKTKT